LVFQRKIVLQIFFLSVRKNGQNRPQTVAVTVLQIFFKSVRKNPKNRGQSVDITILQMC